MNRREFILATSVAICGGCVCSQKGSSPGKSHSIGCYTRPWDAWEYRVALDGIAEAGYRYAGLMTARGTPATIINVSTSEEQAQAIAGEAKSRNLEILSIYAGEFPVQLSLQAGIEGLQKLIKLSAACSCPNLLLGGVSDPQIVDAYYKAVGECCDLARSLKVGLSIKPHGGSNATGPQCREIIRKVGRKEFGLWYDPGNIFYYSDGKLDPVEDAMTVDGLVVGMSIKDFLPPKEVLVTPGTGRVDFPAVLKRLRAGGFKSGPALVECVSKGQTPAAVTAEAAKARRFVEELFAGLR